MQVILKYLKEHGEQLDSEIASGTGISLANVRRGVSDLSALGEVISCHVVRFNDGKKLDGMLYRAAGYIPPPAPGRKSKAQVRANASAAERDPE
ncbi:MAG: ArsR family transcriptional regulator [Betaproteobacteria bacterium]|nr:ArsR family transcriptional regulator [Betaproteobacteria bacterium]